MIIQMIKACSKSHLLVTDRLDTCISTSVVHGAEYFDVDSHQVP